MTRSRVLVVLGTRPEAIKMAPVIQALRSRVDAFETVVCVTAQHREMLDQTLAVFDITPDIDLDLMQPDQTLSGLTSRILNAMDETLVQVQPHWMLVQGDTTTVMASALAAQHRQVRVGHVEAGLRTFDRSNPFPEEMNRVVTDHISDLCFAPTPAAARNLAHEGIDPAKILMTGNTVIDALLAVARQEWTPGPEYPLHAVPRTGDWILVTAHRRENLGAPLNEICRALQRMAEERADCIQIIYPVHRNPRVWEAVHRALGGIPNLHLLPPLDYRSLVYLMSRSKLILTDSGGLQEEASALNKPVLVLREMTERPEVVETGAARLVGTNAGRIVQETYRLLDDSQAYQQMATAPNPFGDGQASRRIVEALLAADNARPFP